MSKSVKSRTPQQCHSHHQKMIKKYGCVETIIMKLCEKNLGQDTKKDDKPTKNLNKEWIKEIKDDS
jgi:hypothetical protein